MVLFPMMEMEGIASAIAHGESHCTGYIWYVFTLSR